MFTPIKNTRVYEQVVEQIKQMIVEGTLQKGDKLPAERELAEQLEVSRASVREAIRALEVVGLVEARQGAGNFIKENFEQSLFEPLSMMFLLEKSNPHEILEIREALELQMVALAAERITDPELTKLKEIIEKLKACEDEESSVILDKEFHYTIAKASNNLLIINVLNVISQLIDQVIMISRKQILSEKSNRNRLNLYHERIYHTLMDRNADEASKAMKEHFNLIQEYYKG